MARLSTKLFLANTLGYVALAAVAVWSFFAVERLVSVNRLLSEYSAPAIRHETSLLQHMRDLVAYERKYAVLDQDPGYFGAWGRTADEFYTELGDLGARLSGIEAEALREVRRAFDAYVAAFGTQGAEAAATATKRSHERLRDATYAELERAQGESAALEARTWKAVVTALVVGLVAALGSSAWLAERLTRDLRRLSRAASQIADGTFTGALPIRRRDEIGEVAQAFQGMADQLEEIDRSKDEFFAQVSHEFRSPITAVREATSLLRDRVAGPIEPKQERLLGIITASCDRLLRLVDRILSVSRLRSGEQTIEMHAVDLVPVMRGAVDALRPQAEARRLDLDVTTSGESFLVQGDEEQLTEIFVNLVDNAIKYSSEGSFVRVDLGNIDGMIEFTVQDAGAGIDPSALPHVFDRYWQAPGTRNGSGLGLAIVKSIVEAHGGTVRAESGQGRGTRFTVRLPASEEG